MKRIHIFTCLLLMVSAGIHAQSPGLAPFDKVVISPYIQVTFVEGDKEDVSVESCTVDRSKLHIEVNNKTLWMYLDGAKQIPKNETTYENGQKEKHPVYNGTVVIATVTYKTLNDLSIRGEESHLCKSPLSSETFKLKIYGESELVFNEVNFKEFIAKLYGESELEIKAGSIKEQRYASYGESKINTSAVDGRTGYITAYGEGDFTMNASDKIKITAFGEAKLHYKGDPEIVKGIHIGEMQIDKMD